MIDLVTLSRGSEAAFEKFRLMGYPIFNCKRIVVFDIEWTSWQGFQKSGWKQPGRYCEIIQIGAVALAADLGFLEIDSFQTLVQPKKNPVLSDFIVNLTGITQVMVDTNGIGFPEALTAFMDFAGSEPVQFVSFGGDEKFIEINCGYYGLPMPLEFANCVDIRKEFLNLNIIGEDWISSDLPNRLGLPPVGEAHNALADSRAISAALRYVGDKLN